MVENVLKALLAVVYVSGLNEGHSVFEACIRQCYLLKRERGWGIQRTKEKIYPCGFFSVT